MTKISAYPEIAVPTIDDLLIGTDVETQNQTKNFSVQSVIDLVTLQQVVDSGNVVLDNTISIYGEGETAISAFSTGLETVTIVNDSSGVGLRVTSTDGGAIIAQTNESTAIAGNSTDGAGIVGSSEFGFGVQGQSSEGYGGRFSSSESYGINVSSQNSVAGYFNSPSDTAVQGQSSDGWGGYFTSNGGYGVHGSASDGYGGYFTSAADYALVANGTAAKPGGGSWSVFSDSRIKENITPYTKGLADILLINTVTYEYNGLAGTTKGAKYTGVIAQEMKEIFPDTVKTYKAKLNEEDKEKTELYDFNSSDLTFALINAVKELKAEIEILKAK